MESARNVEQGSATLFRFWFWVGRHPGGRVGRLGLAPGTDRHRRGRRIRWWL